MNERSAVASGERSNPYDVVDYPGHAFPDTHPARLAAIGVLRGLEPTPVAGCRVLELGCGDGANLIPMAYQLPDARFVGIDLAAAPVERGRVLASALSLPNLELRVMDILAASTALGQFDYIIAHGVYSWVPEPVREHMLALCRLLLAPNGIAFISYLAHPGAQLRDVLRQSLLQYGSNAADPAVRIARARELARAFGGKLDSPDPFQQALRREARGLEEWADGPLYHDWLAPINAPMRITDFMAQASRHGLGFLGEAEYFAMCWRHDPLLAEARAELAAAEERDILLKEQLLDELRCRRFRQTLLCHDDVVRSAPSPDRVLRLAAASRLRPVAAPQLSDASVAEFRSPHDIAVRVDHPVAKAALVHLHRDWPRAVPGDELLAAARVASGRKGPETATADAEVLGSVLLACADAAHVELSAWRPPFVLAAGERPRASAVARAQLALGHQVTTLRHGTLSIEDPVGRALLVLLDGTRTRAQLVDELARLVGAGRLPVPAATTPADDLHGQLANGLEQSLLGLAQAPLLEA